MLLLGMRSCPALTGVTVLRRQLHRWLADPDLQHSLAASCSALCWHLVLNARGSFAELDKNQN